MSVRKTLFYLRALGLFGISSTVTQVGVPLYPIVSLFGEKWWRKLGDWLQKVWVHTAFLLMPRTKLYLQGEIPNSSTRPKIIIANHATEVDWLYLWMLGLIPEKDRTGKVKIILKDAIRKIPIFGWGCRVFQFIFLKRDWAVDGKVIQERIKCFAQQNEPVWVVIFPEGMTINTRSMEKARKWGAENNRPTLQHTLLPRSKGLEAVIKAMIDAGSDPEVFDVTMTFDTYSGEIPTWEMEYDRKIDVEVPNVERVFSGTASKNCYMDIRKYSGAEILDYKGGVENWLDVQFVRKDKLLQHFIEHKCFPASCGEVATFPVNANVSRMIKVATYCILQLVLAVWLVRKMWYLAYSQQQ